MKRTIVVVLVLGLLALGSVAWAQFGYGDEYAKKAYQGPRAQVGWVDPGDVESTIIYGGSYIWENALLSVNYFKADAEAAAGTEVKVLSLEGSYLWRAKTDPGLYYGAGYGMARAEASWTGGSLRKTRGMWNVVVGKEFNSTKEFGKPGPFAEARYVFGSRWNATVDGAAYSGDINGLRLLVGWRF